MGVEVETITAGDGENDLIKNVPSALVAVHFNTSPPALLPLPGQTFPKKGQRVVVHYVGE